MLKKEKVLKQKLFLRNINPFQLYVQKIYYCDKSILLLLPQQK